MDLPSALRFVPQMPSSALFIAFSLLLRMVEGVGTAMYSTASYTLLTQLFPDKKGTIVVSILVCDWVCGCVCVQSPISL